MPRNRTWAAWCAGVALTAALALGGALFAAQGRESAAPAAAAPGGVKVLPPSAGRYLAAFPDFGGTEDEVSAGRITAYEQLTGREIAWAYFSQNWYSGIVFPAAAVQAIHSTGAVPFVRLMPRSGYDDCPEQTFTLQGIKDGAFDSQLRQWARDARDSGIPLMAEFGTEVNGDWFCWNGWWNGGGASGPALFREAYRHVIDLFRAEGANDITWVFHVDAQRSPELPWNTMAAYYPGDSYIDWLGISVYGAQEEGEDWQSFGEVLAAGYGELAGLAPSKPIAVLEFGVTDHYPGRSKAAWLNEAFDAIESGDFPRIKAVSYWHENWDDWIECDETEEDCPEDGGWTTTSYLRLDSSPAAAAAFRARVAGSAYVTTALFSAPPTPPPAAKQNRRFAPGLVRQ